MSTYLTTGFVLGLKPWRESDRLYRLMTASHGKVELIAAGSRKLASKLSPHLLPFTEVEIMVARGKQFDRLAAAAAQQVYLKPPYPLHTSLLGQSLLEAADAVTQFNQRELEVHSLLQRYLAQLADLPTNYDAWRPVARWLLASFLVDLLKATGLALALTQCESCRTELHSPAVFSWSKHEFFHATHAPAGDAIVSIEPAVLTWLKSAKLGGVRPEDGLPTVVLTFLIDYLIGQVGRPLKSLTVIKSLN